MNKFEYAKDKIEKAKSKCEYLGMSGEKGFMNESYTHEGKELFKTVYNSEKQYYTLYVYEKLYDDAIEKYKLTNTALDKILKEVFEVEKIKTVFLTNEKTL